MTGPGGAIPGGRTPAATRPVPPAELLALGGGYRRALLEDVVPFGSRHAIGRECGDLLDGLDRAGSVIGG